MKYFPIWQIIPETPLKLRDERKEERENGRESV